MEGVSTGLLILLTMLICHIWGKISHREEPVLIKGDSPIVYKKGEYRWKNRK